MPRIVPFALAIVLVLAGAASAEPLAVKAVMSPKEQIYRDLPTPQKHFVLFVACSNLSWVPIPSRPVAQTAGSASCGACTSA